MIAMASFVTVLGGLAAMTAAVATLIFIVVWLCVPFILIGHTRRLDRIAAELRRSRMQG